MNLNEKVLEFKRQFNITADFAPDQEFKLDDNKNLLAKWQNNFYFLTNQRNPTKFLAKKTMQNKLKYKVDFLRALKIMQPKKLVFKPPEQEIPLTEQISAFKKFHKISTRTEIPELNIVDNNLSAKWNEKWIPVSRNKKFLASSTLQRKHSKAFLQAFSIPIYKKQNSGLADLPFNHFINDEDYKNAIKNFFLDGENTPKKRQDSTALSELPFNQFKYDKDFLNATKSFFLDEKNGTRPTNLDLEQLPSAMGNSLKTYQMIIPSQYKDPVLFFTDVKSLLLDKITDELSALSSLKYSIGLEVIFRKDNPGGTHTYTDPPSRFYTKQEAVIFNRDTFNQDEINLDVATSTIIERIEEFVQNGSGWKIDSLTTLWIDFAKYEPIKGSSYIPLPDVLKNKRAVINIKNDDDNCLRYTLRSALFPAKHNIEKVSSYPKEDGLNFNNIESPTPISQLKKVEKQNNLAINVYGWENNKVIIHRISDQPPEIKRINTMIIEKNSKKHYVWVKHLNRLLASQHKNTNHKYYCERCLLGYSRQDVLEQHLLDCRGINERAIRIEMPNPDKSLLEFQNWHRQMKVPFVIYADFESIIKKIEGPSFDPTLSNTQKTQIHEACGFSYIVVRSDGMVGDPVLYRGPNATEKFLQFLGEEEDKIKEFCKNPVDIDMTKEDWKIYKNTKKCYICHQVFEIKVSKKSNKKYLDKVRDHCHLTGKFRGAAHCSCNLKLRLNPETLVIPVVFHNLRGYDAHLIMQAISKTEGNIKCIPNNMEKYISFSLRQLRFIDSAQFLLASLDKLVKASKDFHITNIFEPDLSRQALLLRKGVYPYEYMDSWERFEETQLPLIEEFYSTLTEEGISEEDYKHAQKVWETFQCKTLGDYHDLYLKTDVLLLADIFENFRSTCMQQYELDPAHYYTSPGLSWDALLKKTGVKLDLLTDYDMFLFVEKGLRGGISQSSKRFAKANNPLVEDFDSTKPTSYIMYLDANNLYGYAMSQSLPTGNFRWISTDNLDKDSIRDVPPDHHTGCILEVDLEYPKELHNMHNDYPLAPETIEVQDEWLSPYQRQLLGETKLPKIKKLVPNLMDKTKYVLHYRNLQLYLSLGMRLKKIHRVLAFDQSPWMEPYIRMNTELRKKATNDFEKDLFKLFNNAVFGKTMENLRKTYT